MKRIFTLFFVLFLHSAWASNYYFSSVSGDDARTAQDAKNPATPWKSLGKLNASFSSFLPGDSILFKRGETFYGSITITKSGTASLPIVISTYGTGDKPVITSLVSVNNWVSTGNGVYESYNPSFGSKVSIVLMNGAQQEMGRYPNSDATNKGYLTLESHTTNTITDNELSSAYDWTGAELVIRTRRWVTDRCPITQDSANTLTYTPVSSYDATDGYGYFIQNDIKTLDKLGEWYYNPSTKKLSVYFGSNTPSSYDVQATTITNLISSEKFNYIVFDNLNVKGANNAGISVRYGSNIRVSNCDVNFSGENGVTAYYHNYFIIENCTVSNSNANGINFGYSGDYATIRNNKVTNTSIFAGMGGSGDGKAVGIHSYGKKTTIEYNEVTNSGYSGIVFNGDSTIVKNNLVDNYCLTRDDGGGIYTYTGPSNTNKFGRKVIGNIVLNGIGAGEGTSDKTFAAEGIYLDDNSSGIELSNNTIANISGKGIYLNNARDLVIKNNTFYNNKNQFYAHQYRKIIGAAIRNLTVKQNIFFSKNSSQKAAYFTTEQDDNNLIGTLDSNYYARPIDDRLVFFNSYVNSAGTRINENLDLEGWKDRYNKDSASKRTAKPISSYKLNAAIGTNKFANGTFTTSQRGVIGSSCTASLSTADQLDGGCLLVSPTTQTSSLFVNVGDLKAGSKYIVKFSARAADSSSRYLAVSLRKAVSPYTTYTSAQYRKVDLSRRDNEMVFSSSVNETAAQLEFKSDMLSKYYLDNLEIYEVDANITNIEDSVRFVYNTDKVSKTVSLNGGYVDAKNNKYVNSVELQPFQSAVLIKDVNMAPSVSITSPVSKSVAAPASITITATATDTDGTVSKVDFYNQDTLIGTATSSPYTFTWKNVPTGNYSLKAKATDDGSLVTTSAAVAISVYTPNVAPSVNLTSPVARSYTAPASITISAAANDSDGTIRKVQFYNNDTLIGTSTTSPYTFTWNNISKGTYFITAKATDDSSATTTSAAVGISVYNPNVAPSVSLTSPAAGSLAAPASITISAAAADKDGTVRKVQFYNNDTLIGTSTTSPYTITWNNISKGRYSITAKATDDSLATTTSTAVSISVYNPNVAPSVSLTSPVANTAFAAPASITMSANATDADGKITKVEYYNADTLLGVATTSPYTFTWNYATAGTYSIRAKATDDSSAVTTSNAVAISLYIPNVAPSVSLTSPVTTDKYVGPATINISASANDSDGSISSVKFYNGTTLLQTVSTAPYNYAMTNAEAGTYTITAEATDDKGAITISAPVTITVQQNVAPSVTLTSPLATTKYVGPTTINMGATASDVDGTITSVKFYNGTTYLKTIFTSPYTYSISNATAGTYTITAKAFDDKGGVTISAPVTVTVLENVAPAVSITSPLINAKLNGPATINITAAASDKDGSISKVSFYNGTTLLGTKTTSPYTYSWTNVPAGVYTLTATATDNKGAVTTSQNVLVTVLAPVLSLKATNSSDTTNMKREIVQTQGASEVKIFPNPAVSKIQIKVPGFSNANQKANLTITNLSGIVMKNMPVVLSGNTIEVDISSLTSGMYIINIVSDNVKTSKKFIKI